MYDFKFKYITSTSLKEVGFVDMGLFVICADIDVMMRGPGMKAFMILI